MATPHNPFAMSDAQIEDEACLTDQCSSHETYDSSSLLSVVDNILTQANHIVDNYVLENSTLVDHVDVNFPLKNFDPKFNMLKDIACQMHCKPLSEEDAHKTTICILENVAKFSWDSKAIIALAAFAKEYGEFWHLVKCPIEDTLAKSLRLLNRVPAIVSSPTLIRPKPAIIELKEMVKSILELVKAINQLQKLSSTNKYDEEDAPHLYEALRHIHIDTYWAILAIVACSCQLIDPDYKYQLSRYYQKLQSILTMLKNRQELAIKEIGSFSPLPPNPTDIVELLKPLIFHPMHFQHQQPKMFDGSTRQMVSIEVLRKKNVFLFISGLDKIEDDIVHLRPIYEAITKDNDKKDYKILWLPIIDQWNDEKKAKFKSLKEKMPWYVVEYFEAVRHKRHIVEKWQYKTRPIMMLLNNKGIVENLNAMHMIFTWGIEAFPFKNDGHLCKDWNWLWFIVSKYYPQIKELIDDNKYIFFYGSQDSGWIDSFTQQLKAIAENPKIKKADCEIKYFHLEKDDTSTSFWGDINELFASHIQEKSDPVIKDITKFLTFKDKNGWALLAKGRYVVTWDCRDVMSKIVDNFEKWKDQVMQKGFDMAFIKIHKNISQQTPPYCAHLHNEKVRLKVPENVKCPDCDNVMEIASVHYRCCHGRVDSAAFASYGNV